MNDIKQAALAVADLSREFQALQQYYEVVRNSLHFPEIAEFVGEYRTFAVEGYLDLIVNGKVVQLFKRLEEYLRQTNRLTKQMFEISELPDSALPAFKAAADPHPRRMSSKVAPEPGEQLPVPSLTKMFLDLINGKSQDEITVLFLQAKIAKRKNSVAKLHSEIKEAEKRLGNSRFVDFLKKFDAKPEIDLLANAKPVLVRRHRSVPVNFTLEKLGRICEKQQRHVESAMQARDSKKWMRLFQYGLLLDLTGQLVDRQREERSQSLLEKELKMILTKRKISMFYEDNPAIVEALRKEIRDVKKANYQKWLRLKAHLAK